MRRELDRLTSLERLSARAERIGSAMEVWGGSELRPVLERGRSASPELRVTLAAIVGAIVGRRGAIAEGLRAH